MCWTPLYAHYTSTNNVTQTCAILQTTGGEKTEHRFYAEIVTDIAKRNSERKDTYQDNNKNQN